MEPNQVVNASYNLDDGCMEEKGSLDHMIGFLTTKESDFDGFDVVEVPALLGQYFHQKGHFQSHARDLGENCFRMATFFGL